MLKRLGCRFNERLEKFVPPSEKTLRLTLKRVDGDAVDDIVGQWLQSQSNLLLKDLKDLGYKGKELKDKLLERKEILNKTFDKFIVERLQEETVPLEDAIRSIENEGKL